MKKVLILVISCEAEPYGKMIQTSINTWDSVNVEGSETVFYCGKSVNKNTDKIIYLPVIDSLFNMGLKHLEALDWVLKNKEFDYIARVNSSCYVNKKELVKYIQTLPGSNVFAGLETDSQNGFRYLWGGGQFIYSKDVAKLIVENRSIWNHKFMEDESISLVAASLCIPFYKGKACSVNKDGDKWTCLVYGGGENFDFTDFSELNKLDNQFFIRVKQDGKRHLEEGIMKELFKNLK